MASSEAASSEATSAIRYEGSEGIGFAAHVMPKFKLADVERQIGFADLMEIMMPRLMSDQKPSMF
jgi:hypothetical protein